MLGKDILDRFRIVPGKKARLKDHDPAWMGSDRLRELGKEKLKERAGTLLYRSLAELTEAQELLFADNRYSLLIVLQAMDAAGKDGTIKHVMSGVNPQGCVVHSFKKPTAEEYDHTFLWRYMCRLPERGSIGIFNRSYYEDVLVARVHPEVLGKQLPTQKDGSKFWRQRYDDIVNLEQHLVRNGTKVLKLYLNVSKKAQKKRFLERLERPEKNWKFSVADLAERAYWKQYTEAYEDALTATSTDWAPWYVVPADHKWITRLIVAELVTAALKGLDLHYPKMGKADQQRLAEARRKLEKE